MSTVGKSVAAWYRRINNYIRHIGLVLRSAVWYTAEKQRHIGEKCVWGDACREQNGNICFHSGSSLKTSSRVTIVISLHSLFMLQLLRGACLDFKALRYLLNFFFLFGEFSRLLSVLLSVFSISDIPLMTGNAVHSPGHPRDTLFLRLENIYLITALTTEVRCFVLSVCFHCVIRLLLCFVW